MANGWVIVIINTVALDNDSREATTTQIERRQQFWITSFISVDVLWSVASRIS